MVVEYNQTQNLLARVFDFDDFREKKPLARPAWEASKGRGMERKWRGDWREKERERQQQSINIQIS